VNLVSSEDINNQNVTIVLASVLHGCVSYKCLKTKRPGEYLSIGHNRPLLVGWSSFAEGLRAIWDNIYECVCCYNCCHGNAVTGFWTLCNTIYEYVFTISDFPVNLDGKFTGLEIRRMKSMGSSPLSCDE
jgi:hypothetical protein